MISEKKLKSMLYLLDDSDDRIISHIESEIIAMGVEVVPLLEKYWPIETNVKTQERIIEMMTTIGQKALASNLKNWLNSESQDLLQGMLIINRIVEPDIDEHVIENKLDKIKLDAWLELNYDLTSFEKIKILNHIFFDVHQFSGDTDSYHHSKNSLLGSVLERKKGNPILLAAIYSIVAQRLNIPVYGVNLPQHFILGYVKDFDWPPLLRFNDASAMEDDKGGDVLFYINPFNKGLIFNHENIHKFLKQLKLEPKEDYFKTCSNREIVLRILKNLEISFSKENNISKLEQVKLLLSTMIESEE